MSSDISGEILINWNKIFVYSSFNDIIYKDHLYCMLWQKDDKSIYPHYFCIRILLNGREYNV